MKKTAVALIALCVISPARAADPAAGRDLAEPCFACHGENGASVAEDIPNLAGQKAKYLVNQLRAFRDESRKNPLMNAIAAQLEDSEIDDLAAFFNSLPGAAGDMISALPEAVNATHVAFPADYKTSFQHYWTIDFPDRKQVRLYYANETALAAAKAGDPLPDGSYLFVEVYKAKLDAAGMPAAGSDGKLVPDGIAFYTAMAREAGWGGAIPEVLRNADWNYAVFAGDQSLRGGVNQAQCLACHKPLDADSYVFTLDQLRDKARM